MFHPVHTILTFAWPMISNRSNSHPIAHLLRKVKGSFSALENGIVPWEDQGRQPHGVTSKAIVL